MNGKGAESKKNNRRRGSRRRIILDAAAELFLSRGYRATSIDQIVAKVGGSKSTIYSYFANKEKLFAAIIDEVIGEVVGPMLTIDLTDMPPREGLIHVSRRTLEILTSDRQIALTRLVMSEVGRLPSLGRHYYNHGPALGHQGLEAYLRDQHESGWLNVPNAASAAQYFWGMLLHKVMMERYMAARPALDRDEIDAIVYPVVDDFLAMVAGNGKCPATG